MPLSQDLLDAYENADYVFITAANPFSKPRPPEENAAALAALDQVSAASGYPWRTGEGREPDASWVEPSRLVIGIYRDNAQALARMFGQSAIVFIEKGGAPELVVLG